MKTLLIISALLAGSGLSAVEGETFGPYRSEVLRVIDGDTIVLRIAIWPGMVQTVAVRLAGVDAPELRAKEACGRQGARAAKTFTRDFLAAAHVVTVHDVRRDKYGGRVVGNISADGKDLGAALLAAGLARPYAGGKRTSWCEDPKETP